MLSLSLAFKQDAESAIAFVQDLILNGECKKKLLNEIIDYYIETIHGQQNLYILERFLKSSNSCFSLATKKNISHINTFKTELNYLVTICCTRSGKNEYPEAFDISTIEALVENFGKKRHEELVFLIEDGKVSKDLYKILNILYYKVRYQEKNEVLGILGWLVNLKSLNVDEISYDEISAIKTKNDIIWYLWKLALLLTKIRINCENIHNFIQLHLALFLISYSKPKRSKRVEILFYVFSVLSSKNIMKYINCEHVEITCPIQENEPVIENVGDSTSGLEEKQIDLSYLKYYTEIDNDLITEVAKEKQSKSRATHH